MADVATSPGLVMRPLVMTSIAPRQLLRLKSWLPRDASSAQPSFGDLLLPTRVGDIAGATTRALCLGPTEWLLIAPAGTHDDAALRALDVRMAGQGIALVDASDALSGVLLQGAAARDVLAGACGIDLHPARFPAGRCVRTRFAQVATVIVHRGDAEGYELLVARSHADYLQDWLDDAISLEAGSAHGNPVAMPMRVAS